MLGGFFGLVGDVGFGFFFAFDGQVFQALVAIRLGTGTQGLGRKPTLDDLSPFGRQTRLNGQLREFHVVIGLGDVAGLKL